MRTNIKKAEIKVEEDIIEPVSTVQFSFEQETIEPWDIEDRLYEEWRDEQMVSGTWEADHTRLKDMFSDMSTKRDKLYKAVFMWTLLHSLSFNW